MLPRALLIVVVLAFAGCTTPTPNQPPPVDYVPSTK